MSGTCAIGLNAPAGLPHRARLRPLARGLPAAPLPGGGVSGPDGEPFPADGGMVVAASHDAAVPRWTWPCWTPGVAAALRGALAPNTWRAYTSDWRHWSAWAQRQQLPVLPADPLDLARYLVAHARTTPAAEASTADDAEAAAESDQIRQQHLGLRRSGCRSGR